MKEDLLQVIQQLQYKDKQQAETLLLSFLHNIYSPDVQSVELRPLAVSLNSFNGYLSLKDGSRFFFKTHTEPDTVISEYYNAAQLAAAGYPVIQPVFSSTNVGQQLLIYEVVDSPSVFDVAWKIENGHDELFEELQTAQEQSDDLLFQIYLKTLKNQDATEASVSPIHQLFSHRLTKGRMQRFYGTDSVSSEYREAKLGDWSGQFKDVLDVTWEINGQVYQNETLRSIIQRAISILDPYQSGVSIIGHGDAHNGNVFLDKDDEKVSLLFFDPAFAGRHDPLLDLAKPLFHNVFAMWMYFPEYVDTSLFLELERRRSHWVVNHDYTLPLIRKMFWRSKVEKVLQPTLKLLKERQALRQDWRSLLKAALFCCPFLTMNLIDSQKFTPRIALLGLTMAIEMGAESSSKKSVLDSTLDELALAI